MKMADKNNLFRKTKALEAMRVKAQELNMLKWLEPEKFFAIY